MDERWRLITTWDEDPGFNMGLDEALLEGRGSAPTLRFYSWSPDTLSLGYFQRYADVPAAERAGAVVRRITGGGAIHHVNELTFSICVPRDHRTYRCALPESYTHVHAAIAAALARLGIDATPRGDAAVLSDRADTGMCFHASTPLDLVWDARKGVGSAQRRGKHRILHHGSIKLGPSALEGDVATTTRAGAPVTCRELAPTLAATLAEHLNVTLEESTPSQREEDEARSRGKRYVDREFVRRR